MSEKGPVVEEKIAQKVEVQPLSKEENDKTILGAVSNEIGIIFRLQTEDAETLKEFIATKLAMLTAEFFNTFEKVRQRLYPATSKKQIDTIVENTVKTCKQRADAHLAKACSEAISSMSKIREALPETAEPKDVRIPRPAIHAVYNGEALVLPEAEIPFTLELDNGEWYYKGAVAHIYLDVVPEVLEVFSRTGRLITFVHHSATLQGTTIPSKTRISLLNQCGQLHSAEYSLEPSEEPVQSQKTWQYRLYKTNLATQKSSGWKSTDVVLEVAAKTVPSATFDSTTRQLVVAFINGNSCIEIRMYNPTGAFKNHEVQHVIPLDSAQSNEPLGISSSHGLVAVSSLEGVFVLDVQENKCYFHKIVHPVFTEAQQRMITSLIIKSDKEIVLGTAIGCIWTIHPKKLEKHTFFALQHVLAITQLFCEPQVISASTIDEIVLIPEVAEEEEPFSRNIPAPRPLCFTVRDRAVFCLSKYGHVIIFDASDQLEPSVIPSPPVYQTNIVTPWYPGLCLSPGEGRLLSVLYPDCRVKVFKLK